MTLDIPDADRDQVRLQLLALSELGEIEQVTNRYSKILKGYRYGFMLPFDDQSTYSCLIQIEPNGAFRNSRYMRMEWNPSSASRVCANPAAGIRRMLEICVPSYSPGLLSEANVTRIDLAFNLYRIPIDSILVSTILRKPVSGRYFAPRAKYGKTGYLNSQEIGDPESDRYLVIYDKNLEREFRNFEGNRMSTEPQRSQFPRVQPRWARFEIRLRNLGSWGRLPYIQENPFEAYSVTTYTTAQIIRDDHYWAYFLADCKLNGAQAALSKIIDKRERARMRKALYVGDPPLWWNPEALRMELSSALDRAFQPFECFY
ncbi:MAG TPA: hypothetical protein VIM12_04260 [Noviherbaspirillum sp.]|uniref:hypothetical protein n=1 Tax=Noviherbaspirillum sp. TaxID=1926288 RepID=UPI002F91EFAD